MDEHAHGSRLAFEHLLPGLAEAEIAQGQRQRTEHGGASHQLSGRQAVIEKAEHRLTVGADGIGHRAAMAAGAKDQPAMGRGLGIRHQLWEAHHPGPAAEQQGRSQQGGGSSIKAGDAGVGPAGLVQALEEVQPVGLEHALAGHQAVEAADAVGEAANGVSA